MSALNWRWDPTSTAITAVVFASLGVALGVSGLGLGMYLDGRRDVTELELRAEEMRRSRGSGPAP
jgi:hypothetical protein